MVERLKFNKKTKHITIYYYYVREQVDKNIIKIEYISTAEIIIDILIKLVRQVKFDIFIKGMSIAWVIEIFGPKKHLNYKKKDKI